MDIDYRLAFDMAPVGLALSRNRTIMDCNQRLCEMFGTTHERLVGQSFQVLYPSAGRVRAHRRAHHAHPEPHGTYADDRIMRRVDGRFKGEAFLVPRDRPRTEPRSPARGRHLVL
jgi:PAS domain S-box-containing protein